MSKARVNTKIVLLHKKEEEKKEKNKNPHVYLRNHSVAHLVGWSVGQSINLNQYVNHSIEH